MTLLSHYLCFPTAATTNFTVILARKYASMLEMADLSWLFQEVRLLTDGMRFRRFRRFRSSLRSWFLVAFSSRMHAFVEWRPKRNLLALCRLPKSITARPIAPSTGL